MSKKKRKDRDAGYEGKVSKFRMEFIKASELHSVELTEGEIQKLIGLAESEAYKHVVFPNGKPEHIKAWRDLADHLRKELP